MPNADVMLPSTDADVGRLQAVRRADVEHGLEVARIRLEPRFRELDRARPIACLNSAAMAGSGLGSVTFDLLMLPR